MKLWSLHFTHRVYVAERWDLFSINPIFLPPQMSPTFSRIPPDVTNTWISPASLARAGLDWVSAPCTHPRGGHDGSNVARLTPLAVAWHRHSCITTNRFCKGSTRECRGADGRTQQIERNICVSPPSVLLRAPNPPPHGPPPSQRSHRLRCICACDLLNDPRQGAAR